MEKDGADAEAGRPQRISHFQMVFNQGVLTQEMIDHPYEGSGTEDDPYIVVWIPHDPRNPMFWPDWWKWCLTMLVAVATLAVAFVSSAYTGGVREILATFQVSEEVVILGVSLFVLGFAVGPLLWAPMSELYGRQYLFIGTYAGLTFFNAGAAGSQNIQTLLILRFFAGAIGSSPLTNAGGVIADMFPASQRGMAMSVFAAAPFMGPVLGPIVGGFAGQAIGWRWVEGIMAIFTGILWIVGSLIIPETYPPVLLRQRANALSKRTGKVYKSKVDAEQGKITATHAFKTALSRPWVLLILEPIVLLLSIYMAIIYGTLYMCFSAFPIVFQLKRGWSEGVGGLAFLGVAVGMLIGVGYSIYDNKRYVKAEKNDPSGYAPPEARLPPAIIGGIAIPVGLFWFAWTNYPSIHWIVSIIATAPFGFGIVLVFLGIMNYLIDAYTIFAASVLAANSVLRSLFGAIFPLFTTYMYNGLGIHWASSIPAFLSLACVPFPFLFYYWGPAIRVRCKFAAEADEFLKKMRGEIPSDDTEGGSSRDDEPTPSEKERRREEEEEREQEIYDYSYDDETAMRLSQRGSGTFQDIRVGGRSRPNELTRSASQNTTASGRNRSRDRKGLYDENPYDIDRVNTRESFAQGRSRANSRTTSRVVSRTTSKTASLSANEPKA